MRRLFALSPSLLAGLLVLISLPGCASPRTSTAQPTLSPTAEPTGISDGLNLPEATVVVEDQPEILPLVIWMPERLLPVDDQVALDTLNAQIEAFETRNPLVQIDIRRKQARDAGGILATLQTGSAVAPGALPDLTLLNREDLLTAEQNNLIQPFEGHIASGVIGELDDRALRLGMIEEQLYGVAYLLDPLLVLYNPAVAVPDHPAWTFAEVLDKRLSFAFPASRTVGVSEVFLLQYLAAGGELPTDGVMTLNQDALLATLTFYEEARDLGLVDTSLLDYAASSDYLPRLIDGALDAAVINLSGLEQLRAISFEPGIAYLPTNSGTPVTLLNGWVWVLVTTDSDQQALAGQLVNWLMDTGNLGPYARDLGMMPAVPEALRTYPLPGFDSTVLSGLLTDSYLLPAAGTSNTAMRTLHNALVAVLRDERTALEATREAMDQLSG